MNLSELTTQQLKEELERREVLEETYPTPVDKPDWSRLVETLESIISNLSTNGYEDDDSQHYVYEEAMTALYGKEVWKWIRAAQR